MLRVDTALFYDLICEIRIGKRHAAKEHAIAEARFHGTRGIEVGKLPQIRRGRGPDGHFRHSLLDCPDSVDHSCKAGKRVLVRLIFSGVKRARDVRCGIGIAHGQIDHGKAKLIVQFTHQPYRFCQIGRQSGALAHAEAIRPCVPPAAAYSQSATAP